MSLHKFILDQIKASNPVGFVRHASCDVEYVYSQIFSVGGDVELSVHVWDCVYGVRQLLCSADGGWTYGTAHESVPEVEPGLDGALAALQWIAATEDNPFAGIFVFSDIPALLEKERYDTDRIMLISLLTDICLHLQRCDRTVMFTSPAAGVPPELEAGAWEFTSTLPDHKEVGELVHDQIKTIVADINAAGYEFQDGFTDRDWQRLGRSATGLDRQTILRAIKESLVLTLPKLEDTTLRTDTAEAIAQTLLSYKKSRILKLGGEIVHDPKCEVGGLSNVKRYLHRQVAAGVIPSSILLTGLPGCGKSLIASQFSEYLGVPLIRFNVSSLFNKFVGESERNFRSFVETIEASAPVVVFIDELEKAFAQQSNDAVGKRLLGEFLTWLQDKPSDVTVVATANEIRGLPPEMLRTGRFDKRFFVDLPNQEERLEILKIQLDRVPRQSRFAHLSVSVKLSQNELAAIASDTQDCNGSDIEAIVTDAVISAAVDNNGTLDNACIQEGIQGIIPYGKQNEAQVKALREWARTNAVRANDDLESSKPKAPKPRGKATLRI